MKKMAVRLVALALTLAFAACEEKEKAGGDPSKPDPSPVATSNRDTSAGSTRFPGPSTTATDTPVQPPVPGDAPVPGSSSGVGATAGAPKSDGKTTGNTGSENENTGSGVSTGKDNSEENARSTLPAVPIVSRKAAPCAMTTVFNTGGNAVLVRSAPQAGGNETDSLTEGTQVQAVAIVNESYVQISRNGKQGYVHGSFLTCEGQAASPNAPGNASNPGVDGSTDGSKHAVVPPPGAGQAGTGCAK